MEAAGWFSMVAMIGIWREHGRAGASVGSLGTSVRSGQQWKMISMVGLLIA